MRRLIVGIAVALSVALACSWAVLAQGKGKIVYPDAEAVTVVADFFQPGIAGEALSTVNSTDPYAARIYVQPNPDTPDKWALNLVWRISLSTRDLSSQRSLVFDFDRPYPAGASVPCYPTSDHVEDYGKGPVWFTVPAWVQKPSWVSIMTDHEWTKTGGVWNTAEKVLDLRPFLHGTATTPKYVDLIMEFRTPEMAAKGATAYLAHNGPVIDPNILGATRAVVKVTPVVGGFTLTPLSAEEAVGLGPAPQYPVHDYTQPWRIFYDPLPNQNDANLTLAISIPGRLGYKSINATCNLGTFNMPFKFTVSPQ